MISFQIEIQMHQQIVDAPGAGEAQHAEGGDGGVDAPADHGVGGAVLQQPEPLAQAVRARGAGRAAAVVGAAQALGQVGASGHLSGKLKKKCNLLQGDVAGGEVREDPGGPTLHTISNLYLRQHTITHHNTL